MIFDFSFFLCVWWMSCFLEFESVVGGRLDITTRPALYLSLCDAFTLKESQLRRWWLSGNDSLLIWWSESGGSSESEYQWWFAFWLIWIWLISSVFVWDFINWMFYIGTKIKDFRQSPSVITPFHSIPFPLRLRRERDDSNFNLNRWMNECLFCAYAPLVVWDDVCSVSCPSPFPLCLFVKLKTVSRCPVYSNSRSSPLLFCAAPPFLLSFMWIVLSSEPIIYIGNESAVIMRL